MPVPRRNPAIAAACAIAVSLAALSVPVMRGSFPAGHDAPAHLTYTYVFDRAIAEGHVPVRWVELPREGNGQPLFNFYQPGLYYLVHAVHIVVPSLQQSLKLTILFVWWLGALFVFLFLRRLGRLPAGAAAVCFAFSPYLVLNVFVRSAYPELAGIAFAVGVLWALDAWLTGGQPLWLVAVAALSAAVLVSHPPTALIFTVMFAIHTASLLAARRTTIGRAAWLLLPAVAATGLAAFFVLPALLERDLVHSHDLITGGYHYRSHFVFPRQWFSTRWGFGGSHPGLQDGMSFQIGVVQCGALLAAAAMLGVGAARRQWTQSAALTAGFTVAALTAMFMMTNWSSAVWERIPLLLFVQFPWRFLMLVSLAAAVLLAHVLAAIRPPHLRAMAVLCAVALQVQVSHQYLAPKGYITRETIDVDWPEWLRSEKARQSAHVEDGYRPATLPPGPAPPMARWGVDTGHADVREVSIKGHELVLDVTSAGPVRLRINSARVPGWMVWVDGAPSGTVSCQGYLGVDLAPGRHRVRAAFTDTPLRAAANAISVISAVLVGASAAALGLRRYLRRSGIRRSDGPS